jgi:threonine synthase
MPAWVERCVRCGKAWGPPDHRWRCGCGGLLDVQGPVGELPPGAEWRETPTPLREIQPGLLLKMDQLLPTGSFKARGAAVMIGMASELGVGRVIVDSSGNAGKAVAFYAGKAGMQVEVFVPESTAPEKVAAIAALGATVVAVAGGRVAAAVEAQRRVEAGTDPPWYASHVYRPAFHHGVKTLAFELYQQLGDEIGTVVVPAGNGTLVIGLWLGFRELASLGRVVRVPRLVAVQASRCAPLAGMVPTGPTAAVGIAIPSPPRAGQVRAAVLASGGCILTVSEEELHGAHRSLEAMRVEVEPTSAAVWAAWQLGDGRRLDARRDCGGRGNVVLVLTGR